MYIVGVDLSLMDQVVDLGSEWRAFDDNSGIDRGRVDGPANPFLESSFSNGIGNDGRGDCRIHMGLRRAQERSSISSDDKVMVEAIGKSEEYVRA